MKFKLIDANFGDIIRVKVNEIYHYGVYVSDSEIIQFGLPPTDLKRDPKTVEVLKTDLDGFLVGGFLEVATFSILEKLSKKSAEEIVNTARARLGEKGYDIIHNNCEHFVNECVFGKKTSSQVDAIKQMWRDFPLIEVFVKEFPFEIENSEIFPVSRKKEIDLCKNEDVKKQKTYVWLLLTHALKTALGLDINNLNIKKEGTKWVCDQCYFSLSHSNNVVAVAVSRHPVGLDIEEVNFERFKKLKPEKILTLNELQNYNHLSLEEQPKFLNEIWTKKEASFKNSNLKNFFPNKIQPQPSITKVVEINNKKYYLSVVGQDIQNVKFHN